MAENEPKETYLGDGVYASFDGYHVVLRTTNGISTLNIIYLDTQVLQSFLDYVERLRKGADNDG